MQMILKGKDAIKLKENSYRWRKEHRIKLTHIIRITDYDCVVSVIHV